MFALNDLETAHLNRVRSRVNDALTQATALASEIRQRNGHLCAEVMHAEQAIAELERVKQSLERIKT